MNKVTSAQVHAMWKALDKQPDFRLVRAALEAYEASRTQVLFKTNTLEQTGNPEQAARAAMLRDLGARTEKTHVPRPKSYHTKSYRRAPSSTRNH